MQKEEKFSFTREIVVGVVVFLIAAGYLISTSMIQLRSETLLSARLIPNIYGTILLGLAIMQIGISLITLYRKKKIARSNLPLQKTEEVDLEKVKELAKARKGAIINVTLVGILMIAYCIILPIVGFIISSIGLLYGLSMLLTPNYAKKRYVLCAVFSIVTPLITHFIFNNLLFLMMPRGILF